MAELPRRFMLPKRARQAWETARPSLAFVLAWLLLNAMVNVRYPGEEPALWYLIPSVDVLVLFLWLALFASLAVRVPVAGRAALVVALFVVRLLRLGDGIQERYYSQPFNVYTDLPLAPELVRFAHSTLPFWQFLLLVLGVLAGMALLAFACYRALDHAERYLAAPRHLGVFASLAALSFAATYAAGHAPEHNRLFWLGYASSSLPRLKHEGRFLLNVYGQRGEYQRLVDRVQERLQRTPANLAKLRGKNVHFVLIESYGQTVLERPAYVDALRPTYDAFERELGKRGLGIVSSVLDSPTYGGRSWLAHATLGTGVQTENQLQYEIVCANKPRTMARFFGDAGYRTVLVQPGTTREWPKGEFYGFEQKYFAWHFDYAGPPFAWATMPDQYVLDFVRRRELSEPTRPLFIQYVLVSSHAPWSETPAVVDDWSRVQNGALYHDIESARFAIEWPNFANASEAYVHSIRYDLEVLQRFVARFIADDSLLIILGDHQPVAEVNGHSPARGAPVHVLSRDAALLEPFRARGYTPGMRPRPSPRQAMMADFLPNLLADFSTPTKAGAP